MHTFTNPNQRGMNSLRLAVFRKNPSLHPQLTLSVYHMDHMHACMLGVNHTMRRPKCPSNNYERERNQDLIAKEQQSTNT